MEGKNGLYNAWQVLPSQQVCCNAPMIRDMIMKPVGVSTLFLLVGLYFLVQRHTMQTQSFLKADWSPSSRN